MVRVLKAQKIMSHADLFVSVTQQTVKHGAVTNEQFKRAIEDLINNNFVERDQNDPDVYQYIS